MIKNEKQYKIARSWLKKFEKGKALLVELPESPTQPWLRQAQKGSLDSQMEQLREELDEYDELKSGKIPAPGLDVLTSVPQLLIKRRIANGWTIVQLANRLGMHHQQIQRYESTDYASATLETMQRIADELESYTSTPKRKAGKR